MVYIPHPCPCQPKWIGKGTMKATATAGEAAKAAAAAFDKATTAALNFASEKVLKGHVCLDGCRLIWNMVCTGSQTTTKMVKLTPLTHEATTALNWRVRMRCVHPFGHGKPKTPAKPSDDDTFMLVSRRVGKKTARRGRKKTSRR